MLRSYRSVISVFVGALALSTALVAPGASALSPKAAIPAAKSGVGARLLAVGNNHVCSVLTTQQLKCWGWNTYGQLGLGRTANIGNDPSEMGDFLPAVNLGTSLTITQLAMGNDHSCALLSNGTVKCWGSNSNGQLGYGDTNYRGDNAGEMGDNLPAVNLGTGRTARSISAGGAHTCALLDNGSVKCWGSNSNGQLGYGDTNDRGDSAEAGHEMGDLLPPVNLGTGRTARTISAGEVHTCALLDDRTVKCWGKNNLGQLGIGDSQHRGDDPNEMGDNLPAVDLGTRRKAKAISTGYDLTCALLDNATVKCWGENYYGELGYGDTSHRGDQAGEMGNNLPAVNLGTRRKAKTIVTEAGHSCAVLDNGSVKCWGINDQGQLGYGNTTDRGISASGMGDNLPAVNLGSGRKAKTITAGGSQTCAVLDDKTVKCWGSNWAGQLGYGDTNQRGDNAGEMGDNLPAVNLGVKVKSLTAAAWHSCAILNNGSVECWGLNENGRLGQGDTSNRGDEPGEMGNMLAITDLGTGRTAKALSTGAEGRHTCAILDNGKLKCWGENDRGQLGYGSTDPVGDTPGEMGDALPTVNLGTRRKAKQVVVGDSHTCALLDNGTVKCWGANGNGQLGYGDTIDRGDSADVGHRMGNTLPPVDLGRGRKAKALAAGANFTCAILDNGTVKCWGENGSGQLGLGDTTRRGDGPGEMGNALPPVQLGAGRKAKAITAGWGHACAILDNGTVKCWGDNGNGQLGQGNNTKRGDSADAGHEMGDLLPAVPLGSGRKATAIASGDGFVCAILDDKTVKCWGYNGGGDLGLGDTETRGDGSDEMGDNLPAVSMGDSRTAIAVRAGIDNVCVLLDNSTVKCWGVNGAGQLGLGDTIYRGDEPNELGDNLAIVAFTG